MRNVGLRLTENRISLGSALMEGFTVNYSDPYEKVCSAVTGLVANVALIPGWDNPFAFVGIDLVQFYSHLHQMISVNASPSPQGCRLVTLFQ